jgi:HSP20 family protein
MLTEKKTPVTQSATKTGSGILPRNTFFPSFLFGPRDFFNFTPFEMMKRFTEDINQLFGGYEQYRGFEQESGIWIPAIEYFVHEDKFFVRAELPGMTTEDVKVELVDDGLIIKGERKREKEEKFENFYRSELNYGQFFRKIPLPEGVVVEKIEARFNNGVLEIMMPVPEVINRRREIPINVEPETQVAAKTVG